jgi:hypothetical protein
MRADSTVGSSADRWAASKDDSTVALRAAKTVVRTEVLRAARKAASTAGCWVCCSVAKTAEYLAVSKVWMTVENLVVSRAAHWVVPRGPSTVEKTAASKVV